MKNWAFYKLLHGRGLTVGTLAKRIGSSRAHVNEVLNNKPGHGHFTRKRLLPHLTWPEIVLLGWEHFHVEQSSNLTEGQPTGSRRYGRLETCATS